MAQLSCVPGGRLLFYVLTQTLLFLVLYERKVYCTILEYTILYYIRVPFPFLSCLFFFLLGGGGACFTNGGQEGSMRDGFVELLFRSPEPLIPIVPLQ